MSEVKVGTFNVDLAQKGYDLNRMCHSLNVAENRAQFAADEQAYCARFSLNAAESKAVSNRDKPGLYALGGNMYFLAKLDRVPKRQTP